MYYLLSFFFIGVSRLFPIGGDARPTFLIIGFAAFAISIIVQIARYWMQCDNIEELQEMKADKEVFKRQCADLLAEVKLYLLEKFPAHELQIFDKISNNTAQFLAIEYPELKTNETFMSAVNKIVSAKGEIYKLERRMNGKIKEIKARKRSIWLTSLPILPNSKGIEYGLEQENISK